MREAHGDVPGGAFAVIGYGSVGARELNFGSDLDLVFLYDAPTATTSSGTRALDAQRYYARFAQKTVSYLGVQTAAGRLFDIDMRLRPDGAKGLLVSTMASFAAYQRERAWTWEHQALVRARPLCGDPQLLGTFREVRDEILRRQRDPDALLGDVREMRAKMRKELDRSTATAFDLKQGRGGLVDLEFLLQLLVLRYAHEVPQLTSATATMDLLRLTEPVEPLDGARLADAYRALLHEGLRCGLDRRKRLVIPDAQLKDATAVIEAATSRRVAADAAQDRGSY